MIVGERKPFEEIYKSLKGFRKVMVLGCGTCVSVCMAGGEKEVELLASQIRMASSLQNGGLEIVEVTIQRQCDREYIEPILEQARTCDAVLSMACGAGVQLVAEMLDTMPVMPALNTRFIGVALGEGTWSEKCRACGNCLLGEYGGLCPMTLCPKSLVNGPCGGSKDGKCETSSERDCGWMLIYERLRKQGKLDKMRELAPLKDYGAQLHPAKQVHEEYVKAEMEEAHTK